MAGQHTAGDALTTAGELAADVGDRRPLVSVIVIFLDAELFLAEAIESVFAQTYPEWELVLVDDGSTDTSTTIARDYAAQRPLQVRYVEHANHRNHGTSASRNAGARRSAGEYLAFLDADDVWLPEKLEHQVEILRSHPEVALVYGRSEYWHSWPGAGAPGDYVAALGVAAETIVRPPTLLTLALESRAPTASMSDILVRRNSFERVGGFEEDFRGSLQYVEDQAFLAKLYVAEPVYVSGECWYRYRQHGESCVARTELSGRKRAIRLAYLCWLGGYLTDHRIEDARLWRALRRKQRHLRHPLAYGLIRRLRGGPAAWADLLRSMLRRFENRPGATAA